MRQKSIFLMLSASISIISLSCFPGFQSRAFSSEPVQINAEQMSGSMSERSPNSVTTLAQLTGTEWLLEDLGGAGVIDNLQTTLRFDEANRISGRGGCNQYRGAAQLTGEASESPFTVGAVASTRMMCSPAVMNQETRYFQALEKAQQIKLEGPYLLIYGEDGTAPLRFTQLEAQRESTSENTSESTADRTIVAFEGRRNAVRIFTQNGQTLINVYDKQSRLTWMRANPVAIEQTDAGTQYVPIRSESQMTVFVPNSGETPTLTINGKVDR